MSDRADGKPSAARRSAKSVPLPFTTFGDIAALGLEARAWCSSCKSWGCIDTSDPRWSGRRFAGTRLRCQKRRYDGAPCGGLGHLSIAPVERINPASAIECVHLTCGRCVPSWEILDVRLDLPPWSAITLGKGDRFCCRAVSVSSCGMRKAAAARRSRKATGAEG
jgi:hypothetical protein